MLSNLTSAHEQGANIGVAQGAGSLARILGPLFATGLPAIVQQLLQKHNIAPAFYLQALPYLICAAILLATTGLVWQRFGHEQPHMTDEMAAPVPKTE